MHLRERGNRLSRVGVVSCLERNRKGLLQMHDGVVRLAEQIVEAAKVVEHATEVDSVAVRLVELLRALRECACPEPVTAALGHDRRLEGDVRDRERVAEAFRELERELDVLTRRLEVALASRAP